MPAASGLRWLIAGLLFFASALSFFDRQALSVLAPRILTDLGMSNVDYAQAVGAFTLAYSLMFALGGRLIDYFGTRRGLGLMVVFWTAASLLHAAVRSSAQLTLARALLGIGEGGCFPGVAKGVLEWFSARERALAMGIATTGGSAIGAVLAPPVIVWMAQHSGWRGAFAVTGVLGVVWAVAWFVFYHPGSAQAAPLGKNAAAGAEEYRAKAGGQTPLPWSLLLARAEVWGLVLTRALLDPVFYFYMFWIPQYLSQERGASLEDIGRLAWIPFLTLGVASPLGGLVSDAVVRRGWPALRARKTVMALAAALTPVSILALYVPHALAAVALLAVLMFAHGFWMTNYMALIADLIPASSVATVVGLTGACGGLTGFLSSLLAGRIVETYGFTPLFIACGVLYPAGMAIIALTTRSAFALNRAASTQEP